MDKRGPLFICFAGIDGSGKTTQARILDTALKKVLPNTEYVWGRWSPMLVKYVIMAWKNAHPKYKKLNYPEFKAEKNKLFKNRLLKSAWMLIVVLECWLQLFFKIILKLKIKKNVIIADRYIYDSLIDQSINIEFTEKEFLLLLNNRLIQNLFPKPDVTIYLDCTEDKAFSRKSDIPSVDSLKDRRKLFLMAAGLMKWDKIDGSLNIDAVWKETKRIVGGKLKISL